MAFPSRGSRPVHYPESDGRPLAETEIHLQQIFDLYASLKYYYREARAEASGGESAAV